MINKLGKVAKWLLSTLLQGMVFLLVAQPLVLNLPAFHQKLINWITNVLSPQQILYIMSFQLSIFAILLFALYYLLIKYLKLKKEHLHLKKIYKKSHLAMDEELLQLLLKSSEKEKE